MNARLAMILFLLTVAGTPEVNSQIVLTGDFDLTASTMNLHRAVNDSLQRRLYSIIGSAEVDFLYTHERFSIMTALNSLFTYGTNLFSVEPQPFGKAGLYQAWVRYYFSKKFALQAGRIEITYEDQMFFEARDWSGLNTGHNAIIAHYLEPDTSFRGDLGIAANRFNSYPKILWNDPSINNYRYMTYLYLNKRLFDTSLRLTFMNIFNADDNGVNPFWLYGRNTIGGSAWMNTGDWNFNLAGYYQFGHVNDGRKLSSYYYAAYVAWQALDWLQVMPAYEHLSGDNFADSAEWHHTVHSFGLLYGNMTRSFGHSGVLNYTYRRNLHPGLNNLYFQSNIDFLDNLSLEASWHWYTIPYPYIREFNADSLRFDIIRVKQTLMQTVELELTWTPVSNLDLTFDCILMVPGAAMTNYNGWLFKPGSLVTGAYIEAEWTPTILPWMRKKVKSEKVKR